VSACGPLRLAGAASAAASRVAAATIRVICQPGMCLVTAVWVWAGSGGVLVPAGWPGGGWLSELLRWSATADG
jgi:hypothetical protein